MYQKHTDRKGGFGLVRVVSDSVVGEAAEGDGGVPQ